MLERALQSRTVFISSFGALAAATAATFFFWEEITGGLAPASAGDLRPSSPPLFPTTAQEPYDARLPTNSEVSIIQDRIDIDQETILTEARDVYGTDRTCLNALMADINRLQLELEAKYQFYQRAGLLHTSVARLDIQTTIDEIDRKIQAAKLLVDPVVPGKTGAFCA